MTSPSLDSTHGRTTSGVTCNHPIGQHTIEQSRAWHDITALGQHTRSDYFRRRMTSPPLYSTHGRTTSGVACHHRLWTPHTVKRRRVWHSIIAFKQHTRSNYIRRGMPSSPLGSTNGRTTSSVACQYHLWATHTVERRRAWHDITSFGQRTRSNEVWRGMTSPPLGSTHDRTTSGVA